MFFHDNVGFVREVEDLGTNEGTHSYQQLIKPQNVAILQIFVNPSSTAKPQRNGVGLILILKKPVSRISGGPFNAIFLMKSIN